MSAFHSPRITAEHLLEAKCWPALKHARQHRGSATERGGADCQCSGGGCCSCAQQIAAGQPGEPPSHQRPAWELASRERGRARSNLWFSSPGMRSFPVVMFPFGTHCGFRLEHVSRPNVDLRQPSSRFPGTRSCTFAQWAMQLTRGRAYSDFNVPNRRFPVRRPQQQVAPDPPPRLRRSQP
jgi:hypothetical protein